MATGSLKIFEDVEKFEEIINSQVEEPYTEGQSEKDENISYKNVERLNTQKLAEMKAQSSSKATNIFSKPRHKFKK